MLKKLILIVLLASLIFSLVGCKTVYVERDCDCDCCECEEEQEERELDPAEYEGCYWY